MKKLVLAAAAVVCAAGSANAAVLTLQSVSTTAPNNTTFNYQATLGGDEGLRTGDNFVVFDFAGYIAGSIFSTSQFTATTQNVSPTAVVQPGFSDDPTIANLVFTYNGPNIRNTGGPFAPIDFNGLGARSTFNTLGLDAFFTLTTKNNPDGVPGGSNTPVFTLGSVSVPVSAIPEPATWAMMIGGFGLIGAASRRRSRTAVTYA